MSIRTPKPIHLRAGLLLLLLQAGPPLYAQPAPAGSGRPITVAEAINSAYQNHGRISAAEQSVESARQRVRQARTGTLPTVTASVGYQGRGTSNIGGLFGSEPFRTVTTPAGPRGRFIDTDSVTFNRGIQPRISLNYPVYDGGLTRKQVEQARTGVESSIASLAAARNDLAFSVTAAYLAQLRAERLATLRVEQERLALEQLQRVESQIRVGSAAPAERTLVDSEYQNRRVDRIQAQFDVRVAANTLRNNMGLQAGDPLMLVEPEPSDEQPSPLDDLLELAQRQRPEVVQAEAQVRAAQAVRQIARIGRKPRLDTAVSLNVSPADEFNRSDFSVAAGISMPIWDAGLTHAREQEARSAEEAAQALLEQAQKDVSADVQDAYLNLISALQRVAASNLAVAAARVNLSQANERYASGALAGNVLELIQAQVQFATASNAAINALYDVHLARAQLRRAISR